MSEPQHDPLWSELLSQLDALPALVFGDSTPDDELHRDEGLRYLLRYLSAGIAMCVEFDDVDHPELGSLIENRRSWGMDNPDTKYGFCRLAPDAAYRVTGDPGSATQLELQVNTGHFADGRFGEWRALSRLETDELVLGADGSVDIVISETRPADAENWMASGPEASYLHVREYFGDWRTERPALFAVERIEAALPAASLVRSDLERRMELLGLWLTAGAKSWAQMGAGLAGAPPGEIVPFTPPQDATGLGGQAYGMGAYRCAADEAVILEVAPPEARYWSLSLATWFWESADIANRQCSVNHTQATVDPDGIARFVISHRDPGHPNWLDPAGYERGTVAVRYLYPEVISPVAYRTCAFDDLAAQLGAAALAVAPDERRATLLSRRRDLVARYRR